MQELPALDQAIRVAVFVLADHAEAVSGKLYMVGGGWDVVFAANFPTRHAHMSVAAIVVVPWQAANERHTIKLDLQDADGRSLLTQAMEGDFEVGRPPGMRPGDDTNVVLVFNLNNLTFERAGNYSFMLIVDDRELSRTRFKLRRVEVATQSGP